MAKQRKIINCARCHRQRQHGSRGLCTSCYILTGPAPHGDGTRDQYPRTVRRREEIAEDYAFLREQGLSHNEVAARLNRTPDYLRRYAKEAEVSSR